MSKDTQYPWPEFPLAVLENERLDVALLGSNGLKDMDILIVNRDGSLCSSYEMVSRFLRVGLLLFAQDKSLILRHEHRAFVKKDLPIIHLLYYPSYIHLLNSELPSFVANVHDKGRFLLGTRTHLSREYQNYRKREPIIIGSQFEYQLLRYTDMAIMNLLYLFYNVTMFSRDVYFENLLYLLRFSISEILISLLRPEDKITFWDRDELFLLLLNQFPQYPKTAKLIGTSYPYPKVPSSEQLKQLFLSLLEATDATLKAMPNLDITNFTKTFEDAI